MTGMQADREAVKRWLTFLHGGNLLPDDEGYDVNTDTIGGLVHISSMIPSNPQFGFRGRPFSLIEDAVNEVMRRDAQGHEGVYVRTTTLSRIPKDKNGNPGGRGTVEDSRMLPGFAFDMDLGTVGHAGSEVCAPDCQEPLPHTHYFMPLPRTQQDVLDIVAATGLPAPTTWVHSGGGMYPWWMLESPALIDPRDPDVGTGPMEQAKAVFSGIEKLLIHQSEQHGFRFGAGVRDLARVLRIPGTVNRKAGQERMCREMPELGSYDFFTLGALESKVAELVAALPQPSSPAPSTSPARTVTPSADGRTTPGDDYANRNSWADILTQDGWHYLGHQDREMQWRRPGKDSGGLSATTGYAADVDRLFVFSTDAGLPTWEPITKFHYYALTRHNGNHSAAASDLRARGYGSQDPLPSYPRVDLAEIMPPKPTQVVAVENGQAEIEPEPEKVAKLVLHKDGYPALSDRTILNTPWSELGCVDIYAEQFGSGLRYISGGKEGRWIRWDGSRWTEDNIMLHNWAAKALLERMGEIAHAVNEADTERGPILKKAAAKLGTMQRMTQLPNAARAHPKVRATEEDFDPQGDLVTVGNGVLNLQTLELTDFDPAHMLTKKLGVEYIPGAKGERFDRFIREVMPDELVRAYVQRCAAATLLGRADERVIMMLYGESGSGKSAFLEMLVSVFGDFASVADENTFKPLPDSYQGPTDKLHKLKGARLAKLSELAQGTVLNESLVKNVTGQDTQSTRPMYGHLTEWKVEYTAWMATNHLPRLSSNDGAIWNRVKPVLFPGRFIDDQGQTARPEDRDLGRKIAQSEGAAVLNWLLEGLAEYKRIGLAEPAQISEWLGKYRDEVDTTRAFVIEAADVDQIEVAEGKQCSARDLYRAYTAWCVDSQVRPVSLDNFKKRMQANGWVQKRVGAGNMWQGIAIKGMIGQAMTPSGQGDWRSRPRN